VKKKKKKKKIRMLFWSGTVYTSRERDCGNSALPIESDSALYWLLMLEQVEV
jgi:hypothetical protein